MSLEQPVRATTESIESKKVPAGERVIGTPIIREAGAAAIIGVNILSFDDFNGNKSSMFDSGTSGFNQDEDETGRKD